MQVAMNIDESRDEEMDDPQLASPLVRAGRLTNRLRQERNDVERDYKFFELEMRFKVEALERQLKEAQAYAKSLEQTRAIDPETHVDSSVFHTVRRAARVFPLLVHHLQDNLALQENELQTTVESLLSAEWKLRHTEGKLQSRDATLETLQQDNVTLQEQLDATEEELSTSRTQVRELMTRIETLEQETQNEKRSHEDMGNSLARTEAELMDVSRTLADAESARDSLALQVTHLEQDLENTRAELQHAEARYSELQSQQLSTMSSTGVARTLRDQIHELEDRVLRRTEQIGLHQHDIKRLETNLRLQEERVNEMTAELEVAEREKEAMLEDCDSTREARDEALKKCEEFEENLEAMEGRIGQLEGQRDLEIQSLVRVIIQGTSMRRTASRAFLTSLSHHVEESSQLRSRLETPDSSSSESLSEIKHLREVVEEKTRALQVLEEERDEAVARAHTATDSLQTAHVNSRETTSRFDELREENASLQKELTQLRHDLQAKTDELFNIQQEHESWQLRDADRKAEDRSRFESRIEQLQDECKTLREAHENLERRHAETEQELLQANEQLEENASSSSKRDSLERELRTDLADLQEKYDQETKRLRDELVVAQGQLEDAQQQQIDLDSSHKVTLQELSRAKETLESQLKSANAKLDATIQAKGELGALRDQYDEQIKDLEERLNMASTDVDTVSRERDDLQDNYEKSSQRLRDVEFQLTELRTRYDSEVKDLKERLAKATEDLEMSSKDQSERNDSLQSTIQRLQEEASIWSGEKDSLNAELVTLREKHADLDTKLLELSEERETLTRDHNELKARHDHLLQELSSHKMDGEGRLLQLTQEVEQLRVDLKNQVETCQRLEQERSQALAQSEQADQAQRTMTQELEGLTTQLQKTDGLLQQSKIFEQQLQERMTELEAEVQRALSLQRHQDSQIQERDREIMSLQDKLNAIQTTLQQSEQAAQAAEIKYTFQMSQNEQTIASLRREVGALRGNSSIQETITELQEKNAEMERLLRAKCLEIEENDDKFIEMIKEKKKLTSKIDSLTRKVTNLQGKLAAKTTSTPTPAHDSAPLHQSLPAPAVAPVPSHTTPTPSLLSSLHASTSAVPPPVPATFSRTPSTPSSSRARTLSGPSAFPKEKTPDHRIPPPPVFRPRTPESKRLPAIPSQMGLPPAASSSSTSSGKKRRAPDDFDDCDSVPPQVFTTDSVPSQDNDAFTPRIRRALNSVRTGFTPVRGSGLGRSNQLSPRRATTGGPIIADVTNSPRGRKHSEHPADKGAKRSGWLGKMRGGQGTSSANVLSRPVFDRAQNQGPNR